MQDGTFGDWLSDSGFKCRTLERPGIGDHPCIPLPQDPDGYIVKWTVGIHPNHPECYEVTGVPGRTAILIHSANIFEQLLGCVAPGASVAVMDMDWQGQKVNHLGVTASKDTLAALIADMGKEDFRLIIKEAA